ncbi:hypothetical protein SADUNF_Sadunf18G0115200 [Salix dunnii]|uniref:Uncharacterized protein n=1 Tax=Salix dunnii TaxID=1413687 RepID=A0A835J6N9_9ROSI|nr:hypothetical protein SADUNF_Sadunf18G0115200 [Salix dunnii]
MVIIIINHELPCDLLERVANKHDVSLADLHSEESEGSSVPETLERTSADAMNPSDIGRGKNQRVSSPIVSTHTPRTSADIRNRHPSLLSTNNSDKWDEKHSAGADESINPTVRNSRNAIVKDMQKCSEQGSRQSMMGQTKKVDSVFAFLSSATARQSGPQSKNCTWQIFDVKGTWSSLMRKLSFSGDELVQFELIDRAGPVLESLSTEIAGDVLSTLASLNFLEHREDFLKESEKVPLLFDRNFLYGFFASQKESEEKQLSRNHNFDLAMRH